jgi:hypothetical protein
MLRFIEALLVAMCAVESKAGHARTQRQLEQALWEQLLPCECLQ